MHGRVMRKKREIVLEIFSILLCVVTFVIVTTAALSLSLQSRALRETLKSIGHTVEISKKVYS